MTTVNTRFTSLGWNQPSYQVSTQATSSTQMPALQFSKASNVSSNSFYPELDLSHTSDPLAAESGVVRSTYTQLHNPAEVAEGLGAYANVAKYLANPVARESVTSSLNYFNENYGDMFQIT